MMEMTMVVLSIIIQTNETLNKAPFFHVSIYASKKRPRLYNHAFMFLLISKNVMYVYVIES